MNDTLYRRRDLLKLGLGGLMLAGLAGCDSPAPAGTGTTTAPVSLQMIFWGSDTRARLTAQTIDLFQKKYPAIKVASQYKNFNDYWGMYNQRLSSNQPTDLIQMDMRYLSTYVRKQKLLDLTQLIYNQAIDLSDFDPLMLAGSTANNTVYGIPLGGNYQTLFYDKTKLALLGAPSPDALTWDGFKAYAIQLSKGAGGVYGSADNSGDIVSFEVWIRGRNRELYNHDGNIDFPLEDVKDWFAYWDSMRKAGGCPPMNIQAALDVSGTPTDSSTIKGKTLCSPMWSNQFDAFQKAMPRKAGLSTQPLGATPALYLKSSMLMSIAADTKYISETASFINFIINDTEAIKVLEVERGVPGSAQAQALLKPQLTASQQAILTYMDAVSKGGVTRVKEVLDPPGAGQVADTLCKVSQDIGLGHTSIQDGSQSFYSQVQKILAQS